MPTPDQISRKLVVSFRKPLVKRGHMATRKTFRSVRAEHSKTKLGLEFRVYAAGGYKWLERGKRANTELPVERRGGVWRLKPELEEWKRAKRIQIPDYVLARAIARKARAPVPLIEEAVKDSLPYLREFAREFARNSIIIALKELRN